MATQGLAILTTSGHQVPAGLIVLGMNHARRIVLDAGLTVRLARQGGVPLVACPSCARSGPAAGS